MLTAVIKGKSRKELSEDEILSSVFGPLLYLDVNDIWIFSRFLLEKALSPSNEFWPSGNPDEMEILFWNKIKIGKGKTVEPDILIEFKKQGCHLLTLLIEVKWNAPLSGKDQLIRQWRSLSKEKRQNTYHILLVQDFNDGKKEIKASLSKIQNQEKREWEKKLVCMDWHLITFALENSQDLTLSSNFFHWWNDAADFLDRKNIPRFHGFKHLSEYKLIPVSRHSVFFWQVFNGFRFIQRMPALLLGSLKEGPLFYYDN